MVKGAAALFKRDNDSVLHYNEQAMLLPTTLSPQVVSSRWLSASLSVHEFKTVQCC